MLCCDCVFDGIVSFRPHSVVELCEFAIDYLSGKSLYIPRPNMCSPLFCTSRTCSRAGLVQVKYQGEYKSLRHDTKSQLHNGNRADFAQCPQINKTTTHHLALTMQHPTNISLTKPPDPPDPPLEACPVPNCAAAAASHHHVASQSNCINCDKFDLYQSLFNHNISCLICLLNSARAPSSATPLTLFNSPKFDVSYCVSHSLCSDSTQTRWYKAIRFKHRVPMPYAASSFTLATNANSRIIHPSKSLLLLCSVFAAHYVCIVKIVTLLDRLFHVLSKMVEVGSRSQQCNTPHLLHSHSCHDVLYSILFRSSFGIAHWCEAFIITSFHRSIKNIKLQIPKSHINQISPDPHITNDRPSCICQFNRINITAGPSQ